MRDTNDDILQTLGKRMQTLRQSQKISISEFARMTGISRGALQNYESGARQPSLATIKHLSAVLGCSPAWLATFSEQNDGDENYSYHLINPTSPERPPQVADYAMYSIFHIKNSGAYPGNVRVIRATDNLISPDIISGDDVIVDTGRNKVEGVNMYCVKDKTGRYIFRWARREFGGTGFTVYAHNESHFPPIFVDDESDNIEVVGLVIGLTRLR